MFQNLVFGFEREIVGAVLNELLLIVPLLQLQVVKGLGKAEILALLVLDKNGVLLLLLGKLGVFRFELLDSLLQMLDEIVVDVGVVVVGRGGGRRRRSSVGGGGGEEGGVDGGVLELDGLGVLEEVSVEAEVLLFL